MRDDIRAHLLLLEVRVSEAVINTKIIIMYFLQIYQPFQIDNL